MLRLRTLGPTELQAESGEDLRPVLAQPKRLGLLIYLAVEAPDRFVRRDSLLALFWPELDDTQARQALRSALYFLRQHLGDQVLTSRGTDELGSSTAALWTDAVAFRHASDREETEPALALYHGEFLGGLHIPDGSPALEQWMGQVRGELRHRAAGLAWALADRSEREPNPAAAAHWARRAQEIEADDEVALRRLMALLDRSGDPGGAVRAADEFAARQQADLGVDLSAETRAQVDRLRARRSPGPRKHVGPPFDAPAAGSSGAESPVPGPPPPTSRRWPALAGFGFAIVLLTILAALSRRKEPADSLAGPVVVAALRNETGDSTLAIWGRYAGDWITQGMERVGKLPVVPWASALRASSFADSAARAGHGDPVRILGRETGAATVVTGSFYKVNDSFRFRAEVTDAGSGKLVFTVPDVSATADSIEAAIGELRDRLMGGVGLAADPRFRENPRIGRRPPRFTAFAAYDRGYTLFQASNYDDAAPELERAFGLDSSFFAPALTAATAYWNQRRYARADSLVQLLAGHRDEMPAGQALALDRLQALLKGDGPAALAALRRTTEVAPSLAASYNLALHTIFSNRPHEALAALQSIDPAAVQVSTWAPYWIYLAHANHLVGRHDAELKAVAELRSRFPDRSVGLVLQAMALGALGRTAALDSVFAADHSSPNTYWSTGAALLEAGEELLAHGHAGPARGYLDRAVVWLTAQHRSDPKNRYYRDWLAAALYQEGRWEAARPLADSLVAEFPDRLAYRMLAALLAARRGDTATASRLLSDPPLAQTGTYLAARARVAAALGDADRAVALLSEGLDRGVSEFQFDHSDWFGDFAPLLGDRRLKRLLFEGLDGGK